MEKKRRSAESPFDRITTALLDRDPRQSGHDYICPVHDDNDPSLGVSQRNGKVLIHCSAGCETEAVLAALGMNLSDLYNRRDGQRKIKTKKPPHPLPTDRQLTSWPKALRRDKAAGEYVGRYWTDRGISLDVLRRYEIGWDKTAHSKDGRVGAYTFPYYVDGHLVNVKCRWNPDDDHKRKTFRLIKGRETGFLWPDDQLDNDWVVLAEGEPDALSAISSGIPAVTWPTGAGGAEKAALKFAPQLEGINVVVVAHASDTGRKTAKAVAMIVAGSAQSVRVFDPFAQQRDDDSDLNDWLLAPGNDAKKFSKTVRKLPALTPATFDVPPRVELFPEGKFVPPRLGKAAENAGKLRAGPGRSLWRYEKGLYLRDGDEWLAGYTRAALGDLFRRNHLEEVRAWCQANFEDRIPTELSENYINVRNGLLAWKDDTPVLEAWSPDVPSIIQINATWDSKAECPEIEAFLSEVLPKDCLDFIFEWIGYLLIPANRRFQKHLMITGPQDTGKSTLLLLLGNLLGDQATTHHALQSICDDRFIPADLYGKLANIYADLDSRNIQNSGRFKAIAGGDPIQAERKWGHPFKFHPTVRLVFSANEPPGTNDQSGAYYKRWLILPMTRQFTEKEQDKGLDARLATPEELSGLLRKAVRGLRRLIDRGYFDEPESMKRAKHEYRKRTDTVVAWVAERVKKDRGARGFLVDAYDDYKEWVEANGQRALGLPRFKQHLIEVYVWISPGATAGRPTLRGMKLRPMSGRGERIRLAEEGDDDE